jgi:hypothetical protein
MSVSRVHYRERQRLTTADFRAEQEYRIALAGRHYLTHHQWGVVRGLRVSTNSSGGFTLMPGLAIDGYGRELLLIEPVELSVPRNAACTFVILYYCEYPEDSPPGKACHDLPPPRIAHRPRNAASAPVSTPADPTDVSAARVAGTPAGLLPWPVVVAAIGVDCPGAADDDLVSHASVRYVRHRAAVVRSPSGRARIKLGLDRRTDVYHFLLSTMDSGTTLGPRLGIDRDGMTHVWKPLVIWGPRAIGAIQIAQNKTIRIDMPFSPGGLQRLQMTGLVDGNRLLSASMVTLGGAGHLFEPIVELSPEVRLTRRPHTLLFGPRPAEFTLVEGVRARAALAIERPPARETDPPARFSIVMKPTGGQLSLTRPEPRTVPSIIACGDIARDRPGADADGPVGIVFRPAAKIVDDPLAREIYAVTTSAPDAVVPETALRLSGGAEDKTDVSTRLSIGASEAAGPPDYVPRVRMDGGRRIDILAKKDALALDVKGTIYLPPIGKDDPLLPDLMAMAFMAGLRQIGKVTTATTATIALVPGTATSVQRGATLSYTVTLNNAPTIRRVVELITGTVGTGDLIFRSLTSDQLQHQIDIANFTHTASKVQLQIVLLIAEANLPRLVISKAVDIYVT